MKYVSPGNGLEYVNMIIFDKTFGSGPLLITINYHCNIVDISESQYDFETNLCYIIIGLCEGNIEPEI